MIFQAKLDNIVEKNNSLVCVGLDSEIEKIPEHLRREKFPLFEFNKAIIDATYDLVCAYKPNIAFYEAEGLSGLKQLKQTIIYLQDTYPEIFIILDAKRADIGNTSRMYAKAILEEYGADATTVHPYMGYDSVKPFLEYENKLVIFLVRTSNPDAKMFQDLQVNGKHLYYKIAQEIKKWPYDNIGVFVGATYPEELKKVREIMPDTIFLSAGIGAQRGQAEKAVKAGLDKYGKGIMFNSSRTIIYASDGENFAEKAREATENLRSTINRYR